MNEIWRISFNVGKFCMLLTFFVLRSSGKICLRQIFCASGGSPLHSLNGMRLLVQSRARSLSLTCVSLFPHRAVAPVRLPTKLAKLNTIVRAVGVEPTILAALGSKPSAYTSSATLAKQLKSPSIKGLGRNQG